MYRVGAIVLALIGVILLMERTLNRRESTYRYVITETPSPSSLDPLDADSTRNLPVARMIYSTPVEVNPEGSLSSKVLESFAYNRETRKMTWVVRQGLLFSDGSSLSAEDVAFAIARMAWKRPKFPVIEDIEGVSEWTSSKDALMNFPRGIQVDGNRIQISFSRDQRHPLFRFCLEIFSIIPKRCVDLSTGKIACAEIPGSGYYKISSQSESTIDFRKMDDSNIHGKPAPAKIRFEYIQARNLPGSIPSFDDSTVVTGNELKLSPSAMKGLGEKLAVVYAPSSRIGILLLNPNISIFKDRMCRRLFADTYREAYTTFSNGNRAAEASVFTDVLPGYLTMDELSASSSLSMADEENCRRRFATEGVPWAQIAEEDDSFFNDVANLVFSNLNIPESSKVRLQNKKEEVAAFEGEKVAFLAASTGFWAMDPAGDVQMLFTPNMHAFLKHVSKDDHLQRLIQDLKGPGDSSTAFENLNRYLHDQAVFNVFTHVRRFYASPNEQLIAEIPLSITSPTPWQVFRVSE